MKIVHLLDSLNRGGTETLILDVCRRAEEMDLDLIFVATGGGQLESDFAQFASRFIRLQRRLPIDPKIIWQLRRIIKKHNVEIVHAHQAVEGMHAYFAALGTKAKVVLSFHGGTIDAKNERALKFLISRTSKNVYVSEALRQWYGIEFGLDITKNYAILYNGVDAARLISSNKNLREELKIPDNTVLIGMIGNFYVAPRKDQMTLTEALPQVFSAAPNAFCIFVGSIEDGAETKFAECVKFARANNIFEQVRFLGLRTDIPNILNALDVFVLSSLHEGLPVAVLEAMMANVPCVLSDIAPNLEVSRDGEFAEIFETGNAAHLSEKLSILVRDKEKREQLAQNAKTFAAENYSIEAHIRKLKELYQSII